MSVTIENLLQVLSLDMFVGALVVHDGLDGSYKALGWCKRRGIKYDGHECVFVGCRSEDVLRDLVFSSHRMSLPLHGSRDAVQIMLTGERIGKKDNAYNGAPTERDALVQP